MKFKSMTPVNNNYAVLATSKKHYHELCYDRKLDDRQFFWAVLDGGDESPDEIVLVELDETGCYEICERCLVVEKIHLYSSRLFYGLYAVQGLVFGLTMWDFNMEEWTMEKIYFTIAGTKHHYGQEFFVPWGKEPISMGKWIS